MKRVIDVSDTLYKTCIRLVNEGDPRPSESCIANSEPYEPQGDCISREALKEEIVKLCEHINANNGITVPTLAFTRIIDNAPSIEAYPFEQVQELVKLNQQFAQEIENLKRPQGEWVMDNEHTKNPLLWYKCNLCGVYHSPTNFCPNCGSDMRGDNNGQ